MGNASSEHEGLNSHADYGELKAYVSGLPTGKVGTQRMELRDEKRGKAVPVTLRYPLTWPSSSERRPVIIFSHGWMGNRDDYEAWSQEWARHGYVVVHPTHYDSLRDRLAALHEAEGLSAVAQMGLALAKGPLGSPFAHDTINVHRFKERADDISFLIDSLATIIQAALPDSIVLDLEKVGVGGHSYGAFTSMLVGGVELRDVSGNSLGYRDPRVKCTLLYSPQGAAEPSERLQQRIAWLTENSWTNYATPLMVVTGTEDTYSVPKGYDYTWRLCPYKATCAKPLPRYQMVLNKADHGLGINFALLFKINPLWVHLSGVFGLLFWEAHLQEVPQALDLCRKSFEVSQLFAFEASGL